MPAQPAYLLSEAEYLQHERQAEFKSEYLNGEVYAMAGASREHNQISTNLVVSLGAQLLEKPCGVYSSDMKVRTRTDKTNKFSYPDVIADNCSCAGFILGGQGIDPRGIDLRLVGCTLEHNGQLVATAAGAAVMGHPAAAVAWLVRKLAQRGRGLKAGQVVMCGALTEAVAVQPGDTVVARFDRLGTVEVACR